jgi:transcriptional regulator with XRE-family HTH domain
MDIDYSQIGKRIKLARENKGISQKELGEAVDLSTPAIALFESGERDIKNLDIIGKIANKLEVSLKELIEGYEKAPIYISFRASKDSAGNEKLTKALNEAIKRAEELDGQ